MLILLFSILINIVSAVSPLSDVDIDRRIFMTRSLGLSGNMTARINLNESIYFNPASSAHSRCVSFDGGYTWMHHSDIDGRIGNIFINTIDTSNPTVGGGLGYVHRSLGESGSESEFKGILNRVFFKNKLGIGVGVSYYKFDYLQQKGDNFNVDFGALLLAAQGTLVGAVGSNLLGDNDKIKNRAVSIGVRQTFMEFFSFNLDFTHRFKKNILIGGAFEMLDNNGLMFTISLNRNQYYHQTSWGLGMGYVGPKVSFLYGTMNSTSFPFSFSHSFSMRVFW